MTQTETHNLLISMLRELLQGVTVFDLHGSYRILGERRLSTHLLFCDDRVVTFNENPSPILTIVIEDLAWAIWYAMRRRIYGRNRSLYVFAPELSQCPRIESRSVELAMTVRFGITANRT